MIKQALDAYAQSLDRPWVTDRRQTVGASAVGQCARKVWFEKNDDDPSSGAVRDMGYADDYGYRIRGTIMENHWWEPAMRAFYGERFKFGGSEQTTLIKDFLSATPDGLLLLDTETVLTECKSIDPRARLKGPKPEHEFQVHVQMGLVRERTAYQPSRAIISYVDTSCWSVVAEFSIDFDPSIYATAHRRAAAIMTARSASELEPEGKIAGERECRYCGFKQACAAHQLRPNGRGAAAAA